MSITDINPSIEDAYSRQAGVQIERAIGSAVSAQAGYNYLRGHKIILSHNVNVPTLTAAQAAILGVPNLGRPNPEWANISQYDSLGDSWFQGLTVAVGTRPAAWGRARVSYTLSRALDDAGNAFFQTPQIQNDILADKGPSDNDQRHRFVASGSLGDGAGAMRRALGGFQIGYVLSYASGAPFNIVTGTDNNNDTTVNDRPASVGRNSGRMPSTSSVDVRLLRSFQLTAQHRLEVMVEAFNLLNHVNILNVNNTYGNAATPLPSFGQPTAAGDPRQIQLGVRWSF